jgi:hypothetical protein
MIEKVISGLFYFWVFELHDNKASHTLLIKEFMGNLNKDTVAKSGRGFRTRIEAVVGGKRRFF